MRTTTRMNARVDMAGSRIFSPSILTIRIAAFSISCATAMCCRLRRPWRCPWCFPRLFFSFWKAKYSPAGPHFSKRAAHLGLVELPKLSSAAAWSLLDVFCFRFNEPS